ncbi:MAG TPA: ORF6N domain-containing protein [Candidatus Omnitrophota bacterium]|nr:ORF6N domain-containing protein [Candidatus Omnitrophota bacterium]HRZ14101.1 ORF6N domain-containing protein [Candidatus Omnitrophota bacterium]
MKKEKISVEVVAAKILLIRGKKVMLDRDLAELYGVKTKALLQGVRRNLKRFPEDFMFQLSREEVVDLRSQFVTSSWGGHRYLPYVFTQEGVAMLSSVLRSERAVQVNIAIMRAFVKLRELLLTHKELSEKIEELERKYQMHETDIQVIFTTIKKLIEPPPDEPPKPRFDVN